MDRDDIEWVLHNLITLERGEDPDPVNVERMGSKMRRTGWAGFEGPAGLAGAVCGWLERCGVDALYVYLIYSYGKSEGWLAKAVGTSLYTLRRKINRAVNYTVYLSNPHDAPVSYYLWCHQNAHPLHNMQ